MKVTELIERLGAFPGDLEVLQSAEGGYGLLRGLHVATVVRRIEPIPMCGDYLSLNEDNLTIGNPFDALILDLDEVY